MNNLLAQNLKRLRTEKKYTQEEVAQLLNVTAQTVSRWECNASMPDVMLLPEIARLYCVTIDDLFNEHSNAYDNYAQRLGSIYEDTRDPEDFMRARAEFERLRNTGNRSLEDFRMYGIIHQYMMNYCKGKAFEAFDRLLDKAEIKDETYWMTLRQKLHLMAQVGKARELNSRKRERRRTLRKRRNGYV